MSTVEKESKDLWFNAFLIMQGHQIVRFEVDPRNRVTCFFLLSDEDWNKLKLQFQKSEINQFKGHLNQIRDLGY